MNCNHICLDHSITPGNDLSLGHISCKSVYPISCGLWTAILLANLVIEMSRRNGLYKLDFELARHTASSSQSPCLVEVETVDTLILSTKQDGHTE